jgi:hypothetical protein
MMSLDNPRDLCQQCAAKKFAEIFQHLSRGYEIDFMRKNGAPREVRTPNLLIRSQVLYPVELGARRRPLVR